MTTRDVTSTGPAAGPFQSPRDGSPAEAAYLNAALQLKMEDPFHTLVMTAIAERAGKSTSHIYKAFKDKETLFRTLVLRAWGIIDAAVRDRLVDDLPHTVNEPQRAIYDSAAHLLRLTRDPGLADLMMVALAYLRRPESLDVPDYATMHETYPDIRRALQPHLVTARVTLEHSPQLVGNGWDAEFLASSMLNHVFVFMLSGPLNPTDDDIEKTLIEYERKMADAGPPEGGEDYYRSLEPLTPDKAPSAEAQRRRAFAAAVGR